MKTPLDCIMERENNPQMIGEYVNLKTRMSAGDAHYAGELVEGALRSGIITAEDLPKECIKVLGDTHKKRIKIASKIVSSDPLFILLYAS